MCVSLTLRGGDSSASRDGGTSRGQAGPGVAPMMRQKKKNPVLLSEEENYFQHHKKTKQTKKDYFPQTRCCLKTPTWSHTSFFSSLLVATLPNPKILILSWPLNSRDQLKIPEIVVLF